MTKDKRVSETPATAFLKKHRVAFTEHPYAYVDHGGTRASSEALGVDEHVVVKTLVMEDEEKRPLIVLMHGDRDVSTKNLARQIEKKRVEPCRPDIAERHSGYQVGGTSPFGLRKAIPIFVEKTILELPTVYINGGRRGFLVGIAPGEIMRVLDATTVAVALAERR